MTIWTCTDIPHVRTGLQYFASTEMRTPRPGSNPPLSGRYQSNVATVSPGRNAAACSSRVNTVTQIALALIIAGVTALTVGECGPKRRNKTLSSATSKESKESSRTDPLRRTGGAFPVHFRVPTPATANQFATPPRTTTRNTERERERERAMGELQLKQARPSKFVPKKILITKLALNTTRCRHAVRRISCSGIAAVVLSDSPAN